VVAEVARVAQLDVQIVDQGGINAYETATGTRWRGPDVSRCLRISPPGPEFKRDVKLSRMSPGRRRQGPSP
jgi:hypothetical protein